MKDPEFHNAVQSWLTERPTRLGRFRRGTAALWHTRIYKPLRFWGVSHWVFKTGMASSAPAVAWHFYSSITVVQAALASAVIFGGHSLTSLLDGMSKRKKQSANPIVELTIRAGEILQSLPSRQVTRTDVDDSIRSALGVIEAVARSVANASKGEIAVCLATYEGSHRTRMRIRHRNPGNSRPFNKSFHGPDFIAHYACQSGSDPRVVHDVRKFGSASRKSPTQSAVNYRSIFIIPVKRKIRGEGTEVCGFISIDSVKPYAFYGSKENAIIIVCEPIVHHIQELIDGGES